MSFAEFSIRGEETWREMPCLEWASTRDQRGYGVIHRGNGPKKTRKRAHRSAWEFSYGPIPPGMFVCHHCDNPPCVEPTHLFLGSPRDNVWDMLRKGRCHGSTTLLLCSSGHPKDVYQRIGPNGDRKCRACDRDRSRRRLRAAGVRPRRRTIDCESAGE